MVSESKNMRGMRLTGTSSSGTNLGGSFLQIAGSWTLTVSAVAEALWNRLQSETDLCSVFSEEKRSLDSFHKYK